MMQKNINNIQSGYFHRKLRWILITVLLTIVTLSLCITMLMLGNTKYPLGTVINVLLGEDVSGASFAIGTIRFPRMLAGLLAGIAFGLAGNTLQTMLRNPLASPDILGVTSGSSLGAVYSIMVLKLNGSIVSFIAVISGLMVATLIYLLSKGEKFSSGRLILIGIGVQAMLHGVISFLLLKASQYDVPSTLRWLNGSLNGVQMDELGTLGLIVFICGLIIIILGKPLKILELGEETATTLGIKTNQLRILLVISMVFLVAFSTSVTGPISFVAFLAGPIATKLTGTGFPNELPSGLVGAILVLGADLIGQFALPMKFPVGVITGIIGGSYFLLLSYQKFSSK